MNDQMLRQLVLSNPQSDTYDLLEEHISINDKELKSLLINFLKKELWKKLKLDIE